MSFDQSFHTLLVFSLLANDKASITDANLRECLATCVRNTPVADLMQFPEFTQAISDFAKAKRIPVTSEVN